MNTIKVYLKTSGGLADLQKDFNLYQGQFQSKLLNVYVPTSILGESTAVKIGMSYLKEGRIVKISKNYFMNYVKRLTYQNVEYALYERAMPEEFTLYAGVGANAPELIINVVNVADDGENPPIITSLITSQTASLEVMPSRRLENADDEFVDASTLELIYARLGDVIGELVNKQDKTDYALTTPTQTVVGAINENYDRTLANEREIQANASQISANTTAITHLQETYSTGEDFIGEMTGLYLPTTEQLDNFVQTTTGRASKNGDSIIFIQTIIDGTDKAFKYIKTLEGWDSYEIPPIEKASNGTAGIIEGTYGVGLDGATSPYDTLVDIVNGRIKNIYLRTANGFALANELIDGINTKITNIINGTQQVGDSQKATYDVYGRFIPNTYMLKGEGATKQFVKEYASPRALSNIYFLKASAQSGEAVLVDTISQIPDTNGVLSTRTVATVGSVQLLVVGGSFDAEFELSAKNGYNSVFYVSASRNCTVNFVLETYKNYNSGASTHLATERTTTIELVGGEITRVELTSPFIWLDDEVTTMSDGDTIHQVLYVATQDSQATTFTTYSNKIYPSIFNFLCQTYTQGGTGGDNRIINLGMDGVIEGGNVVYEVQNADSYIDYRVNQTEFLVNGVLPVVGEVPLSSPVYITFGDTTYPVYSYMQGSANPITFGDLLGNMTYTQETGYSFTTKMIFLETGDFHGFALSPSNVMARQLKNVVKDTQTIVAGMDSSGTKLELHLSTETSNRLARTLVTPMSTPNSTEIVAVNNQGTQTMLKIGNGLSIENGSLKANGNGGSGSSGNIGLVVSAKGSTPEYVLIDGIIWENPVVGRYIWHDRDGTYMSWMGDYYQLYIDETDGEKLLRDFDWVQVWFGQPSGWNMEIEPQYLWSDGWATYYADGYYSARLEYDTWEEYPFNIDLDARYIWNDGTVTIYSPAGGTWYYLDNQDGEWKVYAQNNEAIAKIDIWSDGVNIYYSNGENVRKFDRTTRTFGTATPMSPHTGWKGRYVWTDGTNTYSSYYSATEGIQYNLVLDRETFTWEPIGTTGGEPFSGEDVWEAQGRVIISLVDLGGNVLFKKFCTSGTFYK